MAWYGFYFLWFTGSLSVSTEILSPSRRNVFFFTLFWKMRLPCLFGTCGHCTPTPLLERIGPVRRVRGYHLIFLHYFFLARSFCRRARSGNVTRKGRWERGDSSFYKVRTVPTQTREDKGQLRACFTRSLSADLKKRAGGGGSANMAPVNQAWQPEFKPWAPHAERRECTVNCACHMHAMAQALPPNYINETNTDLKIKYSVQSRI